MRTKKRVTIKDFKLLLSFLNDPNEATVSVVKNQLAAVILDHPRYKKIIGSLGASPLKETAAEFLEELRFRELQPEFEQLLRQGKRLDLERGLYLLCRIEYPDLKPEALSFPLNCMATGINHLIGSQAPEPTRPIKAMRRYLFDIKKFRGNEKNFFEPDNFFLNKVLTRKIGAPISLSCIYLLAAWRLKLLVHGIALPGHFIVGHREPRGVVYVDPFRGGKILRAKDCEVMVRRLGLPFHHGYLDPVSNLHIFSRLVVNLINIYNEQGDDQKAHRLAQLFQQLR